LDLKDEVGPWNMKDKKFRIVYIAPLKALAAEIVEKFSQALRYLGIKVQELTGDMGLTK
jgi:replicative superfamily II helicase